MKINWGTGIAIAIVLFVVFILSFVYKTIFIEKYEHHLVSEDYYKEELHYQEEIDKLNNAMRLKENVTIQNVNDGIKIIFPGDKDYTKIKGEVKFIRFSNDKLDFKKDIDLRENYLLIEDTKLVSGKWEIRVDWEYEDEKYLLKETWFYK